MTGEATFSSGLVDISPLLHFAERVAAEIVFPKRSKASREFSKLIRDQVSGIPGASGLYVWGRFDGCGTWVTVYVGKTTRGRVASLRYRISDEMREEKPFAWAAFDDIDRLRRVYLGVWGDGPQSIRHFDRAIKKAGARQVAWVACPGYDEQLIRACEAALIAHFSPHANRQQPDSKISLERVTPLLRELDALGVRR